MTPKIGIRQEDKSIWERRAPLIPQHVRELLEEQSFEIVVQPSAIRVFDQAAYAAAGAQISDDLSDCDVIIAIKEVPPAKILPNKTYIFFSHVIKGQPHNMPMLQHLLDQRCTLIDYEKITDESGRRLIFFGRHAGQAGMIDTLWALGRRLDWEGIATPFSLIQQAHEYPRLETAKDALREVGKQIQTSGLPSELLPLVVAFSGYGNVSQGAQDIFDILPHQDVAPSDLAALLAGNVSAHTLYKVVFKEEDMVEPRAPERPFALHDYYQHPENYVSRFSDYVPYLTVLVNGIYWDTRYPRLITRSDLRHLFVGPEPPRVRVVGDISCDIEGSIEFTVRSTEPGNPVYVYEPISGIASDGIAGEGVVVMAVDILPSELPHEASAYFSEILKHYLPAIAHADYAVPFEELDLPPEIKRAVIAHRGELTSDYHYLEQHLQAQMNTDDTEFVLHPCPCSRISPQGDCYEKRTRSRSRVGGPPPGPIPARSARLPGDRSQPDGEQGRHADRRALQRAGAVL